MRALIIFLSIQISVLAMNPPPERDSEAWYQRMEDGIAGCSNIPEKTQRIEKLSEYVRKFGRRIPELTEWPNGDSPISDPRWRSTYKQAQAALISIPGHAKHFADKVARARRNSTDITTDREYHRVCNEFKENIKYLPSPETVQVLGTMTESTEDVLTEEMWKKRAIELAEEKIEWFDPGANAELMITQLGMRGLPKGSGPEGGILMRDRGILASWWDDVKNGRKTFSFKGQSVEYRFKPDGTWETLAIVNPPDDGPKLAGKVVPPVGEKAEPVAGEVPRGWVWLVFPVILAAGLAIWWGARRFAKGS